MRNARTNRALFTPHFVIAIIVALLANPIAVTRCVLVAIDDHATYLRDGLPATFHEFIFVASLAAFLGFAFVAAVVDIAFKVRAIRNSEPARVRP